MDNLEGDRASVDLCVNRIIGGEKVSAGKRGSEMGNVAVGLRLVRFITAAAATAADDERRCDKLDVDTGLVEKMAERCTRADGVACGPVSAKSGADVSEGAGLFKILIF